MKVIREMTPKEKRANYRVQVYFSDTETETMEEKILRMMKNEAVQEPVDCGIMKTPQMSRQSERSAECA